MAAPKGNRNAAKAKDWEAALRHELNNFESSTIQRGLALRAIAKNVVEKAVEGDWNAIDEIANRLDGKHSQSIEHSGSFEHRHVQDLTDDELANIAAGSGAGIAEQASGTQEPSPVH